METTAPANEKQKTASAQDPLATLRPYAPIAGIALGLLALVWLSMIGGQIGQTEQNLDRLNAQLGELGQKQVSLSDQLSANTTAIGVLRQDIADLDVRVPATQGDVAIAPRVLAVPVCSCTCQTVGATTACPTTWDISNPSKACSTFNDSACRCGTGPTATTGKLVNCSGPTYVIAHE